MTISALQGSVLGVVRPCPTSRKIERPETKKVSANSDHDLRVARKIARAKATHMSNAKWRKLFAALHELPNGCSVIGLKLVGRTVLGVPTPGPVFEFEDHFGECGGISFVPFSHIEFVGVSNSDTTNAALIQHLNTFGNWPITEDIEGILINGYEWGEV